MAPPQPYLRPAAQPWDWRVTDLDAEWQWLRDANVVLLTPWQARGARLINLADRWGIPGDAAAPTPTEWVFGTGISWADSPFGPVVVNDGTGNAIQPSNTTPSFDIPAETAFLMVARIDTFVGGSGQRLQGGDDRWEVTLHSGTSGVLNNLYCTGPVPSGLQYNSSNVDAGEWATFAFDGYLNGNSRTWHNGRLVVDAANEASDPGTISYGDWEILSARGQTNGAQAALAAYVQLNRRLTTSEGQQWTEDPMGWTYPRVRTFRGFAPVAGGGDTTVTPAQGALTLTGLAPTILHDRVAPPAQGAITLTGQAPSALHDRVLDVGTAALSLTGLAPTALRQKVAQPDAGALSLTGLAPTILYDRVIDVGAAALTLTGQAPTALHDRVPQTGAGALTLTGFAPTISTGGDTTVDVGAGALTLTGQAPTPLHDELEQPGAAVLSLTGYAPTVLVAKVAQPAQGALTLTGFAPTILHDHVAQPGAGALALTGYAPTKIQTYAKTPGVAALALTGYAPSADVAVAQAATTKPVITLTGRYAPTVAVVGRYAPTTALIGRWAPIIEIDA